MSHPRPASRAIVVEKRKWDGSVAARTTAQLLIVSRDLHAWWTPPGTRRERPRRGGVEWTSCGELAVAATEWWVANCVIDADGNIVRYHVDAALPARREGPGLLTFCDLDLDAVLVGSTVELRDIEQFRERGRAMAYPREVRKGAWQGLAAAIARHRAGRWPFDGWLTGALRLAVGAGQGAADSHQVAESHRLVRALMTPGAAARRS